jgi:Coenzyme PQQ synthesis protein D (PqqD)
MLSLKDRLQPQGNQVAAKVMDGEAIIINLANGIYYSMDKVGGLIWEMIEAKHSLDEMITTIVVRYDVSREQVQADIERLADELLRENLVTVWEGEAGSDNRCEPEQPTRLTYETPKLNVYHDMGDLLALDPPVPGFADTPWTDPTAETPGDSRK